MMMVAPRFFAISCASVRAITSVPPPGAKGTTMRMVFSGYAAKTGSTGNADSGAPAANATSDRILHARPNRMFLLRRGADSCRGHADFLQHLCGMFADRGDSRTGPDFGA